MDNIGTPNDPDLVQNPILPISDLLGKGRVAYPPTHHIKFISSTTPPLPFQTEYNITIDIGDTDEIIVMKTGQSYPEVHDRYLFYDSKNDSMDPLSREGRDRTTFDMEAAKYLPLAKVSASAPHGLGFVTIHPQALADCIQEESALTDIQDRLITALHKGPTFNMARTTPDQLFNTNLAASNINNIIPSGGTGMVDDHHHPVNIAGNDRDVQLPLAEVRFTERGVPTLQYQFQLLAPRIGGTASGGSSDHHNQNHHNHNNNHTNPLAHTPDPLLDEIYTRYLSNPLSVVMGYNHLPEPRADPKQVKILSYYSPLGFNSKDGYADGTESDNETALAKLPKEALCVRKVVAKYNFAYGVFDEQISIITDQMAKKRFGEGKDFVPLYEEYCAICHETSFRDAVLSQFIDYSRVSAGPQSTAYGTLGNSTNNNQVVAAMVSQKHGTEIKPNMFISKPKQNIYSVSAARDAFYVDFQRQCASQYAYWNTAFLTLGGWDRHSPMVNFYQAHYLIRPPSHHFGMAWYLIKHVLGGGTAAGALHLATAAAVHRPMNNSNTLAITTAGATALSSGIGGAILTPMATSGAGGLTPHDDNSKGPKRGRPAKEGSAAGKKGTSAAGRKSTTAGDASTIDLAPIQVPLAATYTAIMEIIMVTDPTPRKTISTQMKKLTENIYYLVSRATATYNTLLLDAYHDVVKLPGRERAAAAAMLDPSLGSSTTTSGGPKNIAIFMDQVLHPDYIARVKRPMWLKKIADNMRNNVYSSRQHLEEDLDTLVEACQIFNAGTTTAYLIDNAKQIKEMIMAAVGSRSGYLDQVEPFLYRAPAPHLHLGPPCQ